MIDIAVTTEFTLVVGGEDVDMRRRPSPGGSRKHRTACHPSCGGQLKTTGPVVVGT
jgi:hypothetical protein